MTQDKIKVLVSGVARSGTTALAEMFNSHDRICLGIERFKFLFLLKNDYSAALFQKERFFEFHEGDTTQHLVEHPRWKSLYDTMATKWDGARVIGDKVPDMAPVLRDFMVANPDFRVIFILRNLKDVGLSWQARADKTSDKWPAGKGFGRACESWAEQYTILLGLVRDLALHERILLLDYDAMFAENAATEEAVLAFLGLEVSAGFHKAFRKNVDFIRKRSSDRKVPPAYVEIYKSVDQTAARELRRHAETQVRLWATRFGQ